MVCACTGCLRSYRMLKKLSEHNDMDWERIISAVKGSAAAEAWFAFKHSALEAPTIISEVKASTLATQARLQAPAEAFRQNQV